MNGLITSTFNILYSISTLYVVYITAPFSPCRWWRISVRRSAVVYPGEWAIERDDVPDDERLLAEIERTFGEDVKDQVGCY